MLEAFLLDSRLELTNNRLERAVKPFVMRKKNWLFSDTNKGTDASMKWYAMIELAKLNGLNIYGYLLHLLTELPKHGENNLRIISSNALCFGLSYRIFASNLPSADVQQRGLAL